MAKNELYNAGDQIPLTVPAGTISGDPIVDGQLPAVALIDRGTDGRASCKTNGVFLLPVKGIDASANAAVAEGDILYLVVGDTPKLSKKNTGVRFGYALAVVTSGATATIAVKVGW